MKNFKDFKEIIKNEKEVIVPEVKCDVDFDDLGELFSKRGIKDSKDLFSRMEDFYSVEYDGGVILTRDKENKVKKCLVCFEEELMNKYGNIYIAHEMAHYIYTYNRMQKTLNDKMMNLEIPSYYYERIIARELNGEDSINKYRYNYSISDRYFYNNNTPYIVAYYYLNYLDTFNESKVTKDMSKILNGDVEIKDLMEEYKLNSRNPNIYEANVEHIKKLKKKL